MNPAPPVTIARTERPYRPVARNTRTARACLVPQRDPAAYLQANGGIRDCTLCEVGLES